MHMSDSLLDPAVGVTFLAISGATLGLASRRVTRQRDRDDPLPLLGVMSAFVFAAQMINIPIPGTGASGHLAGGTLLAVLLGPVRAMLCIAAVLIVQAFLFADGGVIALGCNFFNMGLVGVLVGWTVYRLLAGGGHGGGRRAWAAGLGAWAATVVAAAMVPIQTGLAGRVDLPTGRFLLLMVNTHALIGILEGLVTMGVVTFLLRNRPALFVTPGEGGDSRPRGRLVVLMGATLLLAGFVFLFASELPDGLEKTLEALNAGEREHQEGLMGAARHLQETTSVMPDYGHRWAGIAGVALLLLALGGGVWFLGILRRRGEEGRG